ncbi:MAG: hypothetical protein K2X50_04765 [Gammaproteobacteria bacterium]|nr:hypothetical protein [Gammaproteobacteria bacterium]
MFKDRMQNNHLDIHSSSDPLKPHFELLASVIKKAVSPNIPIPLNFTPADIVNFSTLHQDLYKLALEGPYSLVIRQIFDQIFQLVAMHQMLLLVIQRIEQIEKKRFEDELSATFSDDDTDIPLTAERISPETELHQLREEKVTLSAALQQYQNRSLIVNRVYFVSITKFLQVVASTSVINRAKQLNYNFNPAEIQTLLTPVPRAHIQSILENSYAQQTHTETEKKTMPEPDYLATRSLHDLELKTLMVINTYRNRVLAEMETDLTTSKPNLSDQEKLNHMADLRAEFDRKHSDPKIPHQESTKDPSDPRSRFKREQVQETIPVNSVLAATKLLKSFRSTFESLEQQAQGLHELHKKDLAPEAMIKEMEKHIETAKQKITVSTPQSGPR